MNQTHDRGQAAPPPAPLWPGALRAGLVRGRQVMLFLFKVVLPLYVATAVLKETGLLSLVSGFLAPMMGLWGLPPEAAAVLTAGMGLNLYAAAAVAAPLGLSGAQVSVVGLILGIAHSLPVEGVVVRELLSGAFWRITLLRLGLGLAAGWGLALVLT